DQHRIGEHAGKAHRNAFARPVGEDAAGDDDADDEADDGAEIIGADNADIEGGAEIAAADGIEQQAGRGEIIDEGDERLDAFGRKQAQADGAEAEGDEREDGRDDGENGKHWPGSGPEAGKRPLPYPVGGERSMRILYGR